MCRVSVISSLLLLTTLFVSYKHVLCSSPPTTSSNNLTNGFGGIGGSASATAAVQNSNVFEFTQNVYESQLDLKHIHDLSQSVQINQVRAHHYIDTSSPQLPPGLVAGMFGTGSGNNFGNFNPSSDINDNTIHYTINVTSSTEAIYFNIDPTTGLISVSPSVLLQSQRACLSNCKGGLSQTSLGHSNQQQHSPPVMMPQQSPPTESSSSSLLPEANTANATFEFEVLALRLAGSSAAYTARALVRLTFNFTQPQPMRFRHYPYIIEVDGHRSEFRVGATIGHIEIDNLPRDAVLRFIEGQNNHHRCGDFFHIDLTTGAVSVKRSLSTNFFECFLELSAGSRGHGHPGDDSPTMSTTSTLLQVLFLRGISAELKARKASAFTTIIELSETTPPMSKIVNLITRSRMPSLKSGHHQFHIVYSSLVDGQSYFDMHSSSGIISLRKPLDFELLPSSIELIVAAKKDSNPIDNPMFFNINISLINVNDNAPKFTQQHYTAYVKEGEHRGTFVAQIAAFDADDIGSSGLLPISYDGLGDGVRHPNSRVTYHIIEGNHDSAFVIDPARSGVIKTNIVLDREIRGQYLLRVVASDEPPASATEKVQLSSTCTIEVNIIDVNDNVPVFPPYQEISVQDDTEVGTTLLTLTANDVDTFPPLTYYKQQSLTDSSSSSEETDDLFDIGLYTGRITLKSPLNTRNQHRYQLNILASDSKHTVETQVVIKVRGRPTTTTTTTTTGRPDTSTTEHKSYTHTEYKPTAHVGSQPSLDSNAIGEHNDSNSADRAYDDCINSSGINCDLIRQNSINRISDIRSNELAPPTSSQPSKPSSAGAGWMPASGQQQPSASIPGWILFLIVLLMLVTVVLLFSIVVIRLYHQQQETMMGRSHCNYGMNTLLQKRAHQDSALSMAHDVCGPTYVHHDADQVLHAGHHHHHPHPGYIISSSTAPPPCYQEVTLTSPNVEGHSASSGRGSAEEEDEVDEEIRMIIEGNGSNYYGDGLDNDCNDRDSAVPTTAEYLARLGVKQHDGTDEDMVVDIGDQMAEDNDDVVSEDLQNVQQIVRPAQFSSVRSVRDRAAAKSRRHGGRRGQQQREQYDWPSTAAQVGSQIPTQDELCAAYNWNYLQNWGPQYQPLSSVFAEIAKLKGAEIDSLNKNYGHPGSSHNYNPSANVYDSVGGQSLALDMVETASTMSASTNRSSLHRLVHNQSSSHISMISNNTNSSNGYNSLGHNHPNHHHQTSPLLSSNPLIQASSTSAFSPVKPSNITHC